MESQVLKDEVLMGAESAKRPTEQMSERHDHVKNVTETSRIQPCAKSFILQVYDVLARHSRARFSSSNAARERRIEGKMARNVVRKTSISENYEGRITLML